MSAMYLFLFSLVIACIIALVATAVTGCLSWLLLLMKASFASTVLSWLSVSFGLVSLVILIIITLMNAFIQLRLKREEDRDR